MSKSKVKKLRKVVEGDSESSIKCLNDDSKKVIESPSTKSVLYELSKRSKQLSKAVKDIKGFKLWSAVEPPMICPTRFTSFNRASKCGGVAGGMLGVIHGPSQGGKTVLLAELMYDAWFSGGWGLFIDAECRGVDLKWFSTICRSLNEVVYYKPKTFEQCIEDVEKFRSKFRKAKKDGEVPEGAFLTIGVDSINRLTPGTELAELLKGKVNARGYPLRALLTAKWLDKMLPTLERDEILVYILREGVKLDAMENQKKYVVKGGNAPIYDAGWICRVTSVGKVKKEEEKKKKEKKDDENKDDEKKKKEKKSKVLIGEKHEIEFFKNSMGPHLNETAYFYSSVGASIDDPLGLDFVREVREESIFRKLVKYVSGSGYFYNDENIAPNKNDFLKWLKEVNSDGELNWSMLATELNSEFNDE